MLPCVNRYIHYTDDALKYIKSSIFCINPNVDILVLKYGFLVDTFDFKNRMNSVKHALPIMEMPRENNT